MALIATGTQLLNPEQILRNQAKLGAGMKVADFGCGNGFFTFTAARLVGEKGLVYAVDVQKTCLGTIASESRRHRLNNVKTVWSNLEVFGATNIPAESVDVGLVIHTLYLVDQVNDFLREVARLIKPGGLLIVIDWQPNAKGAGGPKTENRTSEEQVRSAAGAIPVLQETEFFNPGKDNYGLVYRRLA